MTINGHEFISISLEENGEVLYFNTDSAEVDHLNLSKNASTAARAEYL